MTLYQRDLRYVTVSMVEHTAVNRGVVGSSPTRGGKKQFNKTCRHDCLQVFVHFISLEK